MVFGEVAYHHDEDIKALCGALRLSLRKFRHSTKGCAKCNPERFKTGGLTRFKIILDNELGERRHGCPRLLMQQQQLILRLIVNRGGRISKDYTIGLISRQG